MAFMDKLAHADGASTQSDLAYEALLAEILECRLAPGAKIIISDTAGRLGFSPGAVREALSRLAAERWTVATAQKGYSVTQVSADELKDLTRTRITIEQLCMRAAIAHGDVEWETHLVAAYHRLHRIPMMDAQGGSRVNPAWAVAHTTFHAALVAGCDSPWMLTLRSMLYVQSERYRHLSAALTRESRDVDAEHKRILDSCLARDPEGACAAIEDHLQQTAQIVLTSPRFREWQLDPQRAEPEFATERVGGQRS
jgi:GntR family transcriptional regulator, carbon starvation induced regulator